MSADSESERERDYTAYAVNTPSEGIGLHRLNTVAEQGTIEVHVSDSDPTTEDETEPEYEPPACGEWVRIEYVEDWGGIAPWGRTPDNKYKILYEWSQVLVVDHDNREIYEARLSCDVPQIPPGGSGEYEFNIGTHYTGRVTVLPWDNFVNGGLGYDPEESPVSFEIDAVRAVGRSEEGKQ
jgi:hypothetical protein